MILISWLNYWINYIVSQQMFQASCFHGANPGRKETCSKPGRLRQHSALRWSLSYLNKPKFYTIYEMRSAFQIAAISLCRNYFRWKDDHHDIDFNTTSSVLWIYSAQSLSKLFESWYSMRNSLIFIWLFVHMTEKCSICKRILGILNGKEMRWS